MMSANGKQAGAIRLARWRLWLLCPLLLGAAATPPLVVRGPDGFRIEPWPEGWSPACVERLGRNELRVTCPWEPGLSLQVRRAGYEPRRLVLGSQFEVELRDDRWVPLPLKLLLTPLELSASARVFWLEQDELRSNVPDREGVALGPRVPPGSRYLLAVAGPAIRGLWLEGVRETGQEGLAAQLSVGRSLVLVCRHPATGQAIEACRVEVGQPVSLLRRFGLAQLVPERPVEGREGLWLLKEYEADDWASLSAVGLSRQITRIPAGSAHLEVEFPWPQEVEVELVETATGEPPTAANVRFSRKPEGILVEETEVDETGRARVLLAPAPYELFAEAAGYGPVHQSFEVRERNVRLRIEMEKATLSRGSVVDENGSPVEGAVIYSLGSSRRLESLQNLAVSLPDGTFQVTLPGRGPWTVWAAQGDSLSESVLVKPGDQEVTLRLFRECAIQLLPLGPDGSVLALARATLLEPRRFLVRRAETVAPGGPLVARLVPGSWQLVSEETRTSGRFEVPSPCDGLLIPVTISPPSVPQKP